jgi:hypothetical protein
MMPNSHEYDPREDAGFLLEDAEPIPGRIRVTYSDSQQENQSFHINEALFARVVEKYLAAKKKDKPLEVADGTRKARAAKSDLDNF